MSLDIQFPPPPDKPRVSERSEDPGGFPEPHTCLCQSQEGSMQDTPGVLWTSSGVSVITPGYLSAVKTPGVSLTRDPGCPKSLS
jgi:hypothetical protein